MNCAIEAQAKANEQLNGVLTAQRRFLTDVSHQVATPLATIMTNLSILSRGNRSRPSEEAVSDSVAEAERMKRMLGRLRSLAHADEDVPLRRELVDLAELTDDVVRAYAVQAATSGVELVADVGMHARVSVDKDLLREAVANLVDNAVRVSLLGTHVTLSVDRGARGWRSRSPTRDRASTRSGCRALREIPASDRAAGSGLRSRGAWSSGTAAPSAAPRPAPELISHDRAPSR
jgi:signal transduction histidine kinase